MRRLEKPSKERKCIPRLRKHFPRRKIVRSDCFLFLEKVSLSLVSGLKDCLTSLRCLPSLRSGRQLLRSVRQPSFFPTTAESETFSRKKKSVFTPVPSLGNAFLGRGNIYYPMTLSKKSACFWISSLIPSGGGIYIPSA